MTSYTRCRIYEMRKELTFGCSVTTGPEVLGHRALSYLLCFMLQGADQKVCSREGTPHACLPAAPAPGTCREEWRTTLEGGMEVGQKSRRNSGVLPPLAADGVYYE